MTPALRFPDFDGDWLAGKLGDIFTFKNGVNADKSMYGSGRKFINVMDVIADAPIYHDAIIGSVEISDKEFAKNEVVFGDILFQRSSETREEVGQSNIYLDDKSATFGGFVIRGHPKKPIISRYFDALLKTSAVRKDVTSRSGGSTRYNIGQESLEAVAIYIAPTDAEQKKISDFLVVVDERIKLLQRRRDAVQRYKLGMMRRIFSQSTRFKRDDGTDFPDWEEKRLGDIAYKKASTNVAGKIEEHKGIYPIYGASGLAGSVDFFDENEPYIAIVKDGAGVGRVTKCPKQSSTLGTLDKIFPKNPNSLDYIFYYLQLSDLSPYVTGSTIPHIYFRDYSKKRMTTPHPDEQLKIANFLSALDDKVATVSAQIKQAQVFKKGLLQQMFV